MLFECRLLALDDRLIRADLGEERFVNLEALHELLAILDLKCRVAQRVLHELRVLIRSYGLSSEASHGLSG